jgi:hypothetical protein
LTPACHLLDPEVLRFTEPQVKEEPMKGFATLLAIGALAVAAISQSAVAFLAITW